MQCLFTPSLNPATLGNPWLFQDDSAALKHLLEILGKWFLILSWRRAFPVMPECPYLVLLWAIVRLSKRALLGCVVPGGECVIHHCCQLFVKMVDLSLPSAACSLASHARQLSTTEWMLTWGCCSNFPVLESEYIICCQTGISKLCQNLLANFLRYLTLTFKQSDSFDCYEKENYDLPNLCLDNCFSPWRQFDGANQMLSFCTASHGKLGGTRVWTVSCYPTLLYATPPCLLYCKWTDGVRLRVKVLVILILGVTCVNKTSSSLCAVSDGELGVDKNKGSR